MSLIVNLSKKENYLHAKVRGEFSLSRSVDLLSVIIKSCEAKQIHRILIDTRKIKKYITVLERTFLGAFLKKEVSDSTKIAILTNPEQLRPGKVLERYVVRRGIDLKVFTQYKEALKWLNP